MNHSKRKCRRSSKTDSSSIARPNRFRTAYNFYFKQEHERFKKQSGSSEASNSSTQQSKNQYNFRSVSKIIASKWKSLSPQEKKVFEKMADNDLVRFQQEMDAYNLKLSEGFKTDNQISERESLSAMRSDMDAFQRRVAKGGGKSNQNIDRESTSSKCNKQVRPHPTAELEKEPITINQAEFLPERSPSVQCIASPKKQTTCSTSSILRTPKENQNQSSLNNGSKVPSLVWPHDTAPIETSSVSKDIAINTLKNKKTCKLQPTPMDDDDLSKLLTDLDNSSKTKRERPINTFILQTSKLYGREEHVATIMGAYRKLAQPRILAEMVVVSGHSGSGKSALVQHVKKPITDMGGNFISGKFDNFRQMEPLSAIINAFTDFCNEAATKGAENLSRMRVAIQEKIGSAISFLANVIPSICQIVQVPTMGNVNIDGMQVQHMLKYTLQLFVRAIATPDQPLVLFLDDLQWADPLSLDLIESLVTDTENKSLLFVGLYRDNEVNDTHPLATKLRSIDSKQVNITKIKVGDLSKEDANEMISDLIQTPSYLTLSLTNAVYRKTSGNVLFMIQFLNTMIDEGFLSYSPETQQWKWETAMIESKKVADNIVELMLRKILQLPQETQSALKLVACLGHCCEDFVLSSMAVSGDIANFGCTNLIASLELAVREGLLDRVDSNYKFAHDQIQLAAYSLIPEDERGNMHFWIGSQVWANKYASPDKALFIVVGQLNKGALLMKDTNQRIQLAGLNLQAAQRSKSLAAFEPAAFYLNRGISLLEKNSWEDHYDLCLQLYSSCAEAEYCVGDFDEMNKKLEEVFSNARCLDDQLESYFTLISAFNAQDKMKHALDVGLQVLSQLGESFPTFSDIKSIVMVEFVKTKQMVEGKTNNDILKLKTMDDRQIIAAMRIMYILAHASFQAGTLMCALIVLRMVQTSLNHGLCDESAYCFASLGSLSCAFKDINGGYRFGQLSLRLLEKTKTKKCLPGVHAAVYAFVNPRFEHYRESLGPLELAYKEGMRCGDLTNAMGCIVQYCIHSFYCGEELSITEELCRKYDKVLKEHKQDMFRKRNSIHWQAILNLMGHPNDPTQLIGEVMDQDHLLKEALEAKRTRIAASIYHTRSWLAYMFGSYELALKIMEERHTLPSLKMTAVHSCSVVFVEGLISFAIADSTGGTKWNTFAQQCIEEMKEHVLHGPSNCQHKLLLLQAESASLSGKYDTAAQKYDDAIDTAGRNGFVQDQALAYERAGTFYSKQGNTAMGSLCYSKAHNVYLQWGAKCKADQLRLQYIF